MPVTDLNHFNLRASRPLLDDLRDFYLNVVGLTPGYRPPFKSFGYWLYAGSKALLHLSEAGASEARPAGVANTFDHVALACTGLAAFEQRLTDCGVRYTRDEVPVSGHVQLFFNDPAGNGVELNFAQADA